jgi:hypothetical protein
LLKTMYFQPIGGIPQKNGTDLINFPIRSDPTNPIKLCRAGTADPWVRDPQKSICPV